MEKEIIVLSPGNPDDLATWSNVPYFFCKSLEKNNIKIDKVNLSIKKSIYNFPFRIGTFFKRKILQKAYEKDIEYNFYRSKYYNDAIITKIKKVDKKHPNAKAEVIFDFSHAIKTSKKFIMLCDWTIEYYIKEHLNRQPNNYEKKLIKRQYDMMKKADAIISIFPESFKQIKKQFPHKAYYLGHIVNSLEEYTDNRTVQFDKNNVTFIGNYKYKKGLILLIKAIRDFNNEHQNKINLNIIGITKEQVNSKYNLDFCHFYGYLNKSDKKERKKYYKVLSQSHVVVNPTNNWNGVSSLFESLYLGVPIIASENLELKALVKNKDFCFFCDPKSIKSLEYQLEKVFSENYSTFSRRSLEAHNFATQYTWDKFIKKFIMLVDSL